jgi:hypothetical protein
VFYSGQAVQYVNQCQSGMLPQATVAPSVTTRHQINYLVKVLVFSTSGRRRGDHRSRYDMAGLCLHGSLLLPVLIVMGGGGESVGVFLGQHFKILPI